MFWKSTRYAWGIIILLGSFWVSINALKQTRLTYPGETASQALKSMLFGGPIIGISYCSEEVHQRYAAAGPDGQRYPTWHPPFDAQYNCYFDHEHGSDPRAYVGFSASGMPLFGFSASKAGREETHAGYKVFVANDDLNDRAWMILLHQDTGDPQRAVQRFFTLDWHISDRDGNQLVDLHLLADFGFAMPNCGPETIMTFSSGEPPELGLVQRRLLPTVDCAAEKTYEWWTANVEIEEIFQAEPLFEVDNPRTAVDPASPVMGYPLCQFRPTDEGCSSTAAYWRGNRRSVLHPGQWVHNSGLQRFYTDPFGRITEPGSSHAIEQYVTAQGWDSRDCCGADVVFRIQTYSAGVYIAAPEEPAGSAEFEYGLPWFIQDLTAGFALREIP